LVQARSVSTRRVDVTSGERSYWQETRARRRGGARFCKTKAREFFFITQKFSRLRAAAPGSEVHSARQFLLPSPLEGEGGRRAA
jgi:hypothetical protein